MLKKIILCFFILISFFLGGILYKLNFEEHLSEQLLYDCIPNEEVAIEVGKTICQNMYPNIDYDECVWECMVFDNDEWLVFCRREPEQLCGGLPEIRIKKNNGRVVNIELITK